MLEASSGATLFLLVDFGGSSWNCSQFLRYDVSEGRVALVRASGPTPDRGFVVEAVLIGMILFAVSITAGHLLGASPGSLPDWIAAISTLGALFAAAVAARYAGKTYMQEVARERRGQASQVAAWFNEVQWQYGYNPAAMANIPVAISSFTILVRNASPVPVTDVIARFAFVIPQLADYAGVRLPLGDTAWPLAPPNAEPEAVEAAVDVRWTAQELTRDLMIESSEGKIPPWHVEIDLEFTDSGGRRWIRLADGRLVEHLQPAG